MFWNVFNCFTTTCTTLHEEVFANLPFDDCVSSCKTCRGLLRKNEWAGYDPDTDPYDVRFAVIELTPEEPPEMMLKRQIAALQIRIGRGGDPATVRHYEKVLQELIDELPPTAQKSISPTLLRRLSLSKRSRKDSSISEFQSMSTGLWDDYAEIPNFSDFSASDDEVFSDSEDESEQDPQSPSNRNLLVNDGAESVRL